MHVILSYLPILVILIGSTLALPKTISINNGINKPITAAELSGFETYAQFAGAAYCNSDKLIGTVITCKMDVCPNITANGATIVSSFDGDKKDIQMYIAADDVLKIIVVAFMGTHGIKDLFSDLKIFMHDVPELTKDAKVHSGFYAQYADAESAMFSGLELAQVFYPSYAVVLTGHSLGGAVATIAAAFLRLRGHACDLWTFGSPRVGNGAFADFVTNQNGNEYRATHNDDPIPRLPPLMVGYRHTSPEYWFNNGNARSTKMTTSDCKVCSGNNNEDCNASTDGFDLRAHLYYFEHLPACASPGLGSLLSR